MLYLIHKLRGGNKHDTRKIQLKEFKRLSKVHEKALQRLLEMNEPDNIHSHTTQRYWQTHNQIEQCEE